MTSLLQQSELEMAERSTRWKQEQRRQRAAKREAYGKAHGWKSTKKDWTPTSAERERTEMIKRLSELL